MMSEILTDGNLNFVSLEKSQRFKKSTWECFKTVSVIAFDNHYCGKKSEDNY